jgi:hypothetical protein
MARIDELKGLVSKGKGIARGNSFNVLLPSFPGATSREVNLLCNGVNLPGRQIMTQERKIGLINRKIAYEQAYDDVSMTFLILNDYGIKNYFETWQNLAIRQDGLSVGYYNDYTFDVKIQQLRKGFSIPVYSTPLGLPPLPAEIQNRLPKIGSLDLAQGQLDLDLTINKDQVVYECTLEKAFCTSMSAVQLGNDADGVMQLQVQLSYKNWRSSNSYAFGPSSNPNQNGFNISQPVNTTKPLSSVTENPAVKLFGKATGLY